MSQIPKFLLRLGLTLGAFLLIVYLLLPNLITTIALNYYSWTIGEVNFNRNTLDLRDLNSRDQSIHISSVVIHFTPNDLLLGRLSEVWVEGVRLAPKLEGGASFEIPNLLGQLDHIPVDISNLGVQEISLVIPPTNLIAESIQMNGSLSGSLDAQYGHQLTLSANIFPTSQSKGGRLNCDLTAGKFSADLSIHEIRLKDVPTALTLSVKAEQTFGSPLHMNASLTNENHEIFMKIDGGFSGPKSGLFKFKIPSLELDSQKLPLRIFGNEALNKISSYGLILKGEGTLAWEDSRLTPTGKISVEKGKLTYEAIHVRGLSFKVPIEHIWPKKAIQQIIHVDLIESPIMNMAQLDLNVTLDDSMLTLVQAKGDVWEGKAQLTSCILWPLPKQQSLLLTLENVSLQPLLNHLEVKKITAQGLVNGLIPMRLYGDQSLSIDGGLIVTDEPGYLSFQWDAALASTDANMLLAAKALQNFTYQEARLNINKPRYKDLELLLDIKGKNPKLLEGRSFDFKINLSGKILEALEATIKTFEADIKDLKKQAN